MRKKLAAIIFAAAVALGGCAPVGEDGNPRFYGDGELPVAERQPLEEFVSEVEPRLVEFMQSLDAAGASVYLPRSNESGLESCGYPIFGYSIDGPAVFGKAIPEDKLMELVEQHLKPLGFDQLYRRSDEINTTYEWFNLRDGGYVTAILFPDGKLVAVYASGCRPYHGAGKPEHVRTAWEQELISRQPPTPNPSTSSSPSDSSLDNE